MACLPASRWQHASTRWKYQMTDSTEGKWKCFLFWLCYKRNGKRCSCATIELLMNLEDLLSTQEARVNSYASFALINLPRTSITRWLHTTRLPFLNDDLLLKPFHAKTSKTLGDGSFSVKAPSLFNALSRHIRKEDNFYPF